MITRSILVVNVGGWGMCVFNKKSLENNGFARLALVIKIYQIDCNKVMYLVLEIQV